MEIKKHLKANGDLEYYIRDGCTTKGTYPTLVKAVAQAKKKGWKIEPLEDDVLLMELKVIKATEYNGCSFCTGDIDVRTFKTRRVYKNLISIDAPRARFMICRPCVSLLIDELLPAMTAITQLERDYIDKKGE